MHSGVAITSYLLQKSKLINQTGLQLAKPISKTCKANCYQTNYTYRYRLLLSYCKIHFRKYYSNNFKLFNSLICRPINAITDFKNVNTSQQQTAEEQ